MAILRRIVTRLKKITRKKKAAVARGIPQKAKEKDISKDAKEKCLGGRETAVQQAKFYTGESGKPAARILPEELPQQYRQEKIVLQVRDPRWIHAYWEVKDETWQSLKGRLQDAFSKASRVLRVYDVSQIVFDGRNAHRFFDIYINEHANNWYIDTNGPGRSWCVDLGLLLPDGSFVVIVRSNTVYTPLDGPSWITDEEWMIPEDMFARLYGMGFGFGRSSPLSGAWQERIRQELSSGTPVSSGISSVSSPAIKKERAFWLCVNTELIVYGATKPDAKVSIQGREIRLRPDGTFTLRFALPDGKQVMPVQATSADGLEDRTVTPIVIKETR